MATYLVTTANWNSPAFWSGINHGTSGHELDFSGLPSNYSILFDPATGLLQITDGSTVFKIADASNPGGSPPDATLGGSTLWSFFTMVTATAGADNITGSAADDTIFGAAGDDTIDGGTGNDSLRGGADADTFVVEDGFGNDTIVGGEGGTDFDTLDLSAVSTGVTVDWTGAEAGTVVSGADTIAFSEIEHVIFTDLADSINASTETVGLSLDAGDGNDSIRDGSGNDTIWGGDGDDRATLQSGGGDDLIVDVESVYLAGDIGNDTVRMSQDLGSTESGQGSVGIDATWNLSFLDAQNAFSSDGTYTLTLQSIYEFDAYGDNNMLDASNAGKSIQYNSWSGNHTVTGSDFDDLFYFVSTNTSGTAWFDAGAGDDDVTSGRGADTLFGGFGNDTIISDVGNATQGSADYVDGGDGDDVLIGRGGADTILGGTGADRIDGDADADLIVIADNFGNDTVTGGEGVSTGTDNDRIDTSALTVGITVIYATTESGTLSDGISTLTFSEIEQIDFTAFADVLDATALTTGVNWNALDGNDTLFGGSGADTIAGGDGDDYIEGGDGDDLLTTGSGQDTLIGGAGNDTLMNSDGDDSLVGGAGNDSIIATSGNDTLEGGDGDDTLLGGADNDSLVGGDGNDSLDGEAGDDILEGGLGNDTFVYSPGDGNDTITDFNTGNTGTLDDGDSTNNDFIDLSAFYDNIWELHADQADDGILNQSNDGVDGVDYSDNASMGAGSLTFTGASADGSSFTSENTGVVCFTKGTLIKTIRGELPIETLRLGDLVVTRDNGPQPLIWIGQRRLDKKALERAPCLRPIRILPDLIGADAPLIVSPQHGILLRDSNNDETLFRARHMARLRGGQARVMNGCRNVTYIHLLFEAHQIVYANGAPTESFYPGPQALAALDSSSRVKLSVLLPELHLSDIRLVYGRTSRVFKRWGNLPDHLEELLPIKDGARFAAF